MAPEPTVAGNTELTRPENRAHFPALDGLRGLAFLLVLLDHYANLPWGWCGVNVFFVLSGFLITGILVDSSTDKHRVRNFYVRRTLRIFPLYYGLFLILSLLTPWLHWHWSRDWIAWPLYAGNFLRFLSSSSTILGTPLELASDGRLGSSLLPRTELHLGHLWSLCAEEQFYLIWPWVVFKNRNRRTLAWICGTVVFAVPLARVVATHTAPGWMLRSGLLYSAPLFQLDALLLGGLVALLWRGAHQDFLVKAARIIAIAASILAVFYLRYSVQLSGPHWYTKYIYPPWMYSWGILFFNVLSAALVVCVLRPQGLLYWAFRWRFLREVGLVSYGMYLFHDILHNLYQRTAIHLAWHFPGISPYMVSVTTLLAFTGTYALAWLSFRFLESPFLNLKERWTVRS